MKHLVSFLEGAGVALLGQVPAIAASHAVQDFVAKHPADAAIVPLAVGVANVLYRWLRAKTVKKPVAAVVPLPPPTANTNPASATVTLGPPANTAVTVTSQPPPPAA